MHSLAAARQSAAVRARRRLPLRSLGRYGAAAVALLAAATAIASETDPYTHRDVDLADSLEILDLQVNDALDHVAASWDRGEDEWAFVYAVYASVGSLHWIDPLERWAINAPEVDKLPTRRREAVFTKIPHIRARLAGITLGRTINVNGVYIGTDKIGHFISQGRKFYGRFRRLGTEERAARRTAAWEGLIWGRMLSGIYSNADLVANYEGYRFFRGLFGDDIVAGKGPMFRWESGRPIRLRSFTWADHVNPFWDEMLNPASYAVGFVPHLQRRLLTLCDDFGRRPGRYRIENFDVLNKRYRLLGMHANKELLPAPYLSAHCPAVESQHPASPGVAVSATATGFRSKPLAVSRAIPITRLRAPLESP